MGIRSSRPIHHILIGHHQKLRRSQPQVPSDAGNPWSHQCTSSSGTTYRMAAAHKACERGTSVGVLGITSSTNTGRMFPISTPGEGASWENQRYHSPPTTAAMMILPFLETTNSSNSTDSTTTKTFSWRHAIGSNHSNKYKFNMQDISSPKKSELNEIIIDKTKKDDRFFFEIN